MLRTSCILAYLSVAAGTTVNCTGIKLRYQTGKCCGAMSQKVVDPGTAEETTCRQLRKQYKGGNCCTAKKTRLTTTGRCTVNGSCVYSPNFGDFYGVNEECVIKGVPQSPMQVKWFDVEPGYDYLLVNGVKYSANYDSDADPKNNKYGTKWPEGVVPLDGQMIFKSDKAGARSGFEICFDDSSFQGRTPPQPYTPQGAQGYPSWFTPQSNCTGSVQKTTCSNNGKQWPATAGPQMWMPGSYIKTTVSINNQILFPVADAQFGQRLNETVEGTAVLADPPSCAPEFGYGSGTESGKGFIKNAADLAGKIVICIRDKNAYAGNTYWAARANIISYNVPTAKAIIHVVKNMASFAMTDGSSICSGGCVNGYCLHPDVSNAGCNVPSVLLQWDHVSQVIGTNATFKIQPASEGNGMIKSALYVTVEDNPYANSSLVCADDPAFKDPDASAHCPAWAPDCPISKAITSCNGEVGKGGVPCEIGGYGPDGGGYYYSKSAMQTIREKCKASCSEECLPCKTNARCRMPYASYAGKYVPLPKRCVRSQLGEDAGDSTWWQMSGDQGCNPGEAEFSSESIKYVKESDLEAGVLHILSYSYRFENPKMPHWELSKSTSEWVPYVKQKPGLTIPDFYTSRTLDMALSKPEELVWYAGATSSTWTYGRNQGPSAPMGDGRIVSINISFTPN